MSGIFFGYVQRVGGSWNNELYVVDWEELNNAQTLSEVRLKKFLFKEVAPVKIGDNFRFPVAEGALGQPGHLPRHRLKSSPPEFAEGNLSQESPEPESAEEDGDSPDLVEANPVEGNLSLEEL